MKIRIEHDNGSIDIDDLDGIQEAMDAVVDYHDKMTSQIIRVTINPA